MFWTRFGLAVGTTTIVCTFALAGPVQNSVARVGKSSISEQDLLYRIGTEKAYGIKGFVKTAALAATINELIEFEVAGQYSGRISEEEIASFSRHVEETTKAPGILAKIKEVFKGDLTSYERLYLKPKIVNRKLRSFYSTNLEFHNKERALIEKAYGLATSGYTFKGAAAFTGLQYLTFNVKNEVFKTAPELQQYVGKGDAGEKDPLIAILEELEVGEVYNYVVEDDLGYKVIRLTGKNEKKYSVEAIFVKKRPFDEWLHEEGAKLKIEILDAKLKKKIRKNYPNVWWVKALR